MTPLPRTVIEFERGDTVSLRVGPVVVVDPETGTKTPVDLTAVGTKMTLTAKRKITDATAVFSKTEAAGIELDAPVSAGSNYATVTIAPADTSEFTAATELVFDVQLEEPDGRVSTVARGTLRVALDATA